MALNEKKLLKWKEKGKVKKLIKALSDDSHAERVMEILSEIPEKASYPVARAYFEGDELFKDRCRRAMTRIAEKTPDLMSFEIIRSSYYQDGFPALFVSFEERRAEAVALARSIAGVPGPALVDALKDFIDPPFSIFGPSGLLESIEWEGGLLSDSTFYPGTKAKELDTAFDYLFAPLMDYLIENQADAAIMEGVIGCLDFVYGASIIKTVSLAVPHAMQPFIKAVEATIPIVRKRSQYLEERVRPAYPQLEIKTWDEGEFSYEVDQRMWSKSVSFRPTRERSVELYEYYGEGFRPEGLKSEYKKK